MQLFALSTQSFQLCLSISTAPDSLWMPGAQSVRFLYHSLASEVCILDTECCRVLLCSSNWIRTAEHQHFVFIDVKLLEATVNQSPLIAITPDIIAELHSLWKLINDPSTSVSPQIRPPNDLRDPRSPRATRCTPPVHRMAPLPQTSVLMNQGSSDPPPNDLRDPRSPRALRCTPPVHRMAPLPQTSVLMNQGSSDPPSTRSYMRIAEKVPVSDEFCESEVNSRRSTKNKAQKSKYNKSVPLVAHNINSLSQEDSALLEKRTQQLNKADKCKINIEPSSLVFPDNFYEGILLNATLTQISWSDTPHYLKLMQHKCTDVRSKEVAIENDRQIKNALAVLSNQMTQSEIHIVCQALVHTYLNIDELQLFDYYDISDINPDYTPHPEIKVAPIDVKHYTVKVTKTKQIPALFERMCCEQTETPFSYFLNNLSTRRNILTPNVINAIIKSCLQQKTDPMVVIEKKCNIWKINAKPEQYSKYSWCKCYLPPIWTYMDIAVDNKKAKGDYEKHTRFFAFLRIQLVHLRERILAYTTRYIEISKLPKHEQVLYKKTLIQSFVAVMRTPAIQSLFIAKVPKRTILDSIYQTYMPKMKAQVVKTPIFRMSKARNKAQRSKNIHKDRQAKHQMQQDDIYQEQYQDEIQMQQHDYCDELQSKYLDLDFVKSAPRVVVGKCLIAFTIIVGVISAAFSAATFFSDNHRYARAIVRALTPVTLITHRINELVDEMSGFVTASGSTISESTQVLLVQMTAIINIIYSIAAGKNDEALRHSQYIMIANINNIKTIFLQLIPTQPGPMQPPSYEWFYRGETYNLTAMAFHQTVAMQERNAPQRDWDNFHIRVATGYPGYVAHDDHLQAGPVDTLATWLKPLSKLVFAFTDGDLDEKDVRNMNAHYQYLSHKSNFFTEQASMLGNAVSFVCRLIYGYDPLDPEYHKYTVQMLAIANFVEDNFHKRADLATNRELMNTIILQQAEAIKLSRNPQMSLLPQFLRTYFTNRFTQLETLANLSHVFLKGTHVRQEPISIMFTGPPGVGKTNAIGVIRTGLANILGLSQGPEAMYIHNPDNEFFEGYVDQPFFCMDDMFKHADVSKRANESTTAVNVVNTAAFNMPMAFIDKGSRWCSSSFVFMTTNIANDGYEKCTWQVGLTDPDAFLRRVHIMAHRVDPLNPLDPDADTFIIQKCDFFPDEVGKPYTAAEIAVLMLQIRFKKYEQFQNNKLDAERMLKLFPDMDVMRNRFLLPTDKLHNAEIVIEQPQQVEEEEELPPLEEHHQQIADDSSDDEEEEIEEVVIDAAQSLFTDACKAASDTYNKLDVTNYIKKVLAIKFADQDPDNPQVLKKIKFYTTIFFILTAMTVATSAWYLWKNDEPQSVDFNSRRAHRRRVQRLNAGTAPAERTVIRKQIGAKTTTQSNESNHMLSLINNVSRTSIAIYGYVLNNNGDYERGTGQQVSGFHFRDGYVFFPAHFVQFFTEYTERTVMITMSWQGGSLTIPFPEVFEVVGQDCCYFQIQKKINLPKALAKYVWKASEVSEISEGTPMHLVSLTQDLQSNIKPVTKARNMGPLEYADSFGKVYRVDMCLNYWENTQLGDCGSLLALQGKQGEVKVIGYHVCMRKTSTTKFGFSLGFDFESLEKLIALTQEDNTQSGMRELPFATLATVEPHLAHFPPSRSKLVQSPMFEWYGKAKYMPAKLAPFTNSAGEYLDPLLLSMQKLRTEHTPATEVPDFALEYLQHTYPATGELRVLTMDEAVQGIPGTEIPSVSIGTSAGYPWNLGKKKGKQEYITIKDDQTFEMTPEFRATMEVLHQLLLNGEDITVLWNVLLKDETVSLEKVEAGRTRLFSGCPIHFLIFVRMYFGDALGYIKSLAGEKSICVGLNPHSIEWTNLHNRLATKARSVVAGDFKNWDGSIPEFLAVVVVLFFNQLYQDDERYQRVREILCKHFTNAVHICFWIIYQTRGSGPTGNPMTSEWNSLIQALGFIIVLILDLGLSVEDFELALYGDDNVCTIDRPGITCATLAPHFMRRFGWTYTHWSKTAPLDTVDTLETISFIGRKWVRDDYGIYRAPLPLETLVETWYWNKGKQSDDLQMLSVAETYFLELSHHGKRVFEDYSLQLLRAVKKRMPHLHKAILAKKKMFFSYYQQMYHPDSQVDITQSKDVKFHEENKFADTIKETRNTEYTDRAVNDPTPTQSVELGSYNDVAPTNGTSTNTTIILNPQNNPNMEVFDMSNVLERTYNISNVAWTTASASGASIYQCNFPAVLFAQPFITDKMKGFRAFTAGVELSARITASKTLYGKLIVAFQPFRQYYPPDTVALATDALITNLYSMTGIPHMLCDASSSDVMSMVVPFVSPFRYMDLLRYGPAEIGTFNVTVMSPLTSIDGSVATATVIVNARFVDPHIYLPIDTVQSKNFEGVKKVHSADAGKEVLRPVNSFIGTTKLIGNTMANLAYDIAKDTAVAMILGLSKPGTMNTSTIVTPNCNFNINNGMGVDTCVKLAVDNENAITTQTVVGGVSTDEMTLEYMVSTPSMVTFSVWLPGSTPLMVASMGVDANLCFMDHLKLNFDSWSGSTKVKCYITASTFQTIRLVFYLARTTTSDWKQCYHRVVEIQGSTEVDMLIPYLEQGVMTRTVTPNVALPLGIFCQVLAWSQTDDAVSAPITIATYKAGCSDFHVGGPLDVRYVVQSAPREAFNTPFEPLHPSFQGFEHDGLLYGENIKTIRNLLHKLTPITSVNAPAHFALMAASRASGSQVYGPDIWALFYKFWRGSIRAKAVFVNTTPAANYACMIMHKGTLATSTAYHGITLSNPVQNSFEAEFPYYSEVLFDVTSGTPLVPRYIYMTQNEQSIYFKGCGDDFSFHWLVLPPAGTYTVNTAVGGYNGAAALF